VSLEIAILAPALLLVVFTIVQTGLWFYARNLAHAAAQEGVTAAAGFGARPDAGTSRAKAFLAQQAGDSLTRTVVSSAGSTATQAARSRGVYCPTARVNGLAVTESVTAPVERFTTDSTPTPHTGGTGILARGATPGRSPRAGDAHPALLMPRPGRGRRPHEAARPP
jgi:Flp pilus assembly protein TadG